MKISSLAYQLIIGLLVVGIIATVTYYSEERKEALNKINKYKEMAKDECNLAKDTIETTNSCLDLLTVYGYNYQKLNEWNCDVYGTQEEISE